MNSTSVNPLLYILQTPRRAVLVLLLITSLIWLPIIRGTYFSLDTDWLVFSNPVLQQSQFPFSSIFLDLSKGNRLTLGAEYLPVRDIFVWFELLLFGQNASFHHLSSFLLYLIIVVLMFRMTYQLFDHDTSKSFWATLLFSIHNTHIESVAWLANKKDLLSLLFLFLAILCFQKYNEDKRTKSLIFIFFFGTLAYWSKNTAIAIPPILICWSLLQNRKIDIKLWVLCLTVFSALLYLTMNVGKIVGMFAERRGENLWEMLLITFDVWGKYLHTLLWPQKLSVFYVEDPPSFSLYSLVGFAFFVGICLFPVYTYFSHLNKQRRNHHISFGCLWILFALLPVSQITPIQNLQADRYLLLPSIGFSIIMVEIYANLHIKRRILPPIYIAVMISFTVLNIQNWKTEEGIWKICTKNQPQEARCWVSLSTTKEKPVESLQILEEAQHHLGATPHILQAKGGIFYKIQDYEHASFLLQQAWEKDDNLRVAGNNLIQTYRKQGLQQKALEIGLDLTTKHPDYPTGWNSLGTIYMDIQSFEKAKKCFLTSLSLEPYALLPLLNLGNIAYLEKKYDIAIQYWQQVLQIQPTMEHAQQGIEAARKQLQ